MIPFRHFSPCLLIVVILLNIKRWKAGKVMKRVIAFLMIVIVLTGCSLFGPKITLTDEEEKYIKDAYFVTQFTKDVFEEFSKSADEYETGEATAEEMFGHMLVFSMLESSIEKLPDAPEKYEHITEELSESFALFSEGVTGLTVGLSGEKSEQKDGIIEEELTKLNEAETQLDAVNKELTTTLEDAGLEEELQSLKMKAKETSDEVIGTIKNQD